jgi:hypothetical protein
MAPVRTNMSSIKLIRLINCSQMPATIASRLDCYLELRADSALRFDPDQTADRPDSGE